MRRNIDIKKISPNYVLALINKWKNSGWYPKNVKISRGQILEKNMLEVFYKLSVLEAAEASGDRTRINFAKKDLKDYYRDETQ